MRYFPDPKHLYRAPQSSGKGFARSFLISGAAVAMLITLSIATQAAAPSQTPSQTPGQTPIQLDNFVANGKIVSAFGIKRVGLRDHTGIDIAAEHGTPILAPTDAVVVEAKDLFRGEPRYGKTVVLEFENGLTAWFAHLDSYSVQEGDRVKAGETFATVGTTGQPKRPHLHVETYQDHQLVDPRSVWAFLN